MTTISPMTSAPAAPAHRSVAATLPSVLFMTTLGLGLVLAAGFAQSETMHGAAHDVRHATAFPCH